MEPVTRLEQIASGKKLEPVTRLEMILSGEDLTPVTRLETFLKEAVEGGGVTPTGTINITENGDHDVTRYATAAVNVPQLDTSDATLQPSEAEEGKTYYADGEKKVGTKPIRTTDVVLTDTTPVAIPQGSYDGTVVAKIDPASIVDLAAENIRKNCSILGQDGSMESGFTIDDIISRTGINGEVKSNAASIGDNIFMQTAITGVDMPLCATMGTSTFAFCAANTIIKMPLLTEVKQTGFNDNSVLKKVYLPSCTKIGKSSFQNCGALESFVLPALTTVGGTFAVKNDSHLVDVYAPLCTHFEAQGLQGMGASDLVLEGATYAYISMCSNSTALKTADFYVATTVSQNCFSGCTSFDTLIMRSSTLPTLGNINAFNNTCFASGKSGGTLYVPNDLISQYEQATNWSVILAYANNSIQSIEGSQYEICIHIAAGYGGSVSGGGHYAKNATVTITATPDTGYRFLKWSDDDTNASRTFTATQNLSVYAIFEEVSE